MSDTNLPLALAQANRSGTQNTWQIDVLQVAERMLADPNGPELTRLEAIALAGFVIQQNSDETPELRMPTDPFAQALPASLAAAVAAFIRAHDEALHNSTLVGDWPDHSDAAFNTLKTRFEKEFPHGQS